jgi:hypothetical protein
MVSRVKYDTLPKLSKRQIKAHPGKIIGLLIGVIFVIISKGTLFFPILVMYIFFGLIRYVVQGLMKLFKKNENELKVEEKFSRIDI